VSRRDISYSDWHFLRWFIGEKLAVVEERLAASRQMYKVRPDGMLRMDIRQLEWLQDMLETWLDEVDGILGEDTTTNG
jgi:hypothetical protein